MRQAIQSLGKYIEYRCDRRLLEWCAEFHLNFGVSLWWTWLRPEKDVQFGHLDNVLPRIPNNSVARGCHLSQCETAFLINNNKSVKTCIDPSEHCCMSYCRVILLLCGMSEIHSSQRKTTISDILVEAKDDWQLSWLVAGRSPPITHNP